MIDSDIMITECVSEEKNDVKSPTTAERGSVLELKQLEHLFPQCEGNFLKEVLEAYSYDLQASTAYIEEELDRDGYMDESKWSEGEEDDPLNRLYTAALEVRRKVREPLLRLEYKRTVRDLAPGLYIVPRFRDGSGERSRVDMTKWDGVIFIRRGFYRGGIFKFTIQIPKSYPDLPPKVTFHTKLYHILVHPESGVLDLRPRFPRQRLEGDGKLIEMSHFSKYIKDIFFFHQLWKPLDQNSNLIHKAALSAWHRFLDSEAETEFLEKVKECVDRSLVEVYECPSGFSLKFSNLSQKVYDDLDSKLKLVDQEMRKLEPDPKKCDFWSMVKS